MYQNEYNDNDCLTQFWKFSDDKTPVLRRCGIFLFTLKLIVCGKGRVAFQSQKGVPLDLH